MNWPLQRRDPALPNSCFWTWDHSTNWVLDDPGMLTFGCHNRYMKRPETYLEDYRRLTDLAATLGVKGIIIWGFLRDDHGGIDHAKRVADYAASKGIAIMPGVGTTWYGGIYYEGDHPYNIETFVKKHPDARMVNADGAPQDHGACPSHPAYRDWVHEALQWLYREFAIGGINLENGDFLVCHCSRCREHKEQWPAQDPDFFRLQAMSYQPALETIADELGNTLATYATYTGFVPSEPGTEQAPHLTGSMQCRRPAMFDRLPTKGICQWTLTGMVRAEPAPLAAYLDDGEPDELYDNPRWPKDVRPPSARSAGFMHQASQWGGPTGGAGRYQYMLSTIKEGCLRAYHAGLEGISIHGEMSARYVPWALNYLAFSHFIHWPTDTLRQFGRTTLGPVLGGEDDGEAFIEALSHMDAGTLTDVHRKDLEARRADLRGRVARGQRDALEPWRFWHWLAELASGYVEPHTVGFF